MDWKKQSENLLVWAVLIGFAGALVVVSAKSIMSIMDVGLYADNFPALIGFATLLGFGIEMLIIAGFQIVAISVKRKGGINEDGLAAKDAN